MTSKPSPPPKYRGMRRLSLALQGGGSHGAFTWGVLDRLMSDGRIFIDGISGASAGAINAVVFSDGFLKGKRQGAIDALAEFWQRLSQQAMLNPGWFRTMQTPFGGFNIDDSPAFQWFDMTTRMLSPYQFNPMGLNPLQQVLEQQVNFENLRNHSEIRLFVAATNVRSSKVRLFRTPEITADALMASSCIPFLMQAVEIDGEAYWDGGFLGNPAIYPLIHECTCHDVLLVMVNPMQRKEVPRSAREILNRVNEISFNATLISEMSNFAVISKLIEDGALKSKAYDRVNFHLIEADAELAEYSASSKMNADIGFLRHLHDMGHAAADMWLAKHFKDIEKRSSVDVFERFMKHDE